MRWESETPDDEFKRIACEVASLLNSSTPASGVAIDAPNSIWDCSLRAALNAAGVRTSSLFVTQPFSGDIREKESCGAARLITALKSVANPADATAWCCWCGFGDYPTNSTVFATLRTQAHNKNAMLPNLLADAQQHGGLTVNDGSALLGGERVMTAFNEGCTLVESAKGLHGKELLMKLAQIVTHSENAHIPALLLDVLGPLENAFA